MKSVSASVSFDAKGFKTQFKKMLPEEFANVASMFVKVDYDEDVSYVSEKQSNGEFSYYIFLEYLKESCTGNVIITKAYEDLTKEQQEEITESLGIEVATPYEVRVHGFSALASSETKPAEMSVEDFMQWMMLEGYIAKSLLGFYLDAPQNMMGATGWDFLNGVYVK